MTNQINTSTSLYGVFGNPVSHSLSPAMQNAAFSHIGYNGVYLAFGVKEIGAAIAGIKAMNIKGISVTIPHKVSVLDFLDELDEMARQIGAVNTIINRNGVLTGYNSDYLGAIAALTEKTTIQDKEVAILGAGGAARAIGFGILSEGGKLTILNRSLEKGERLAKSLQECKLSIQKECKVSLQKKVEFRPLAEFKQGKYQILINTTPLGMTPNIETTPVPEKLLEKGMVVMDIVYNPLKTRLLNEAENAGCIVIDGVSMFVYQGAFQFELWTGEKAPIDVMRQSVLEGLL